jgi:hypothetical protein
MHRFLLTLTAAATVLATGLLASSPVAASPLSASMGTNLPVEALAPIENVAVCFYANGWNGPGLYECGSYRRHGYGWHGPRVGDGRNGHVDRDRRGHQSDGPSIRLQTEGRGRY